MNMPQHVKSELDKLTAFEREIVMEFISSLGNRYLNVLDQVAESRPDFLPFVFQNLTSKTKSLTSQDAKSWQQILKEEEDYFAGLSNKEI